MLSFRELLAGWRSTTALSEPVPVKRDWFSGERTKAAMVIAPLAVAQVQPVVADARPWGIHQPPAPLRAGMAMDGMAMDLAPVQSMQDWAGSFAISEGVAFPGYAYLAELSQRPEYRRVSEIIASEATRKWIKLSGDEDRCNALEAAMKKFAVQTLFREVSEQDGFFGRSHLYIDLGDRHDAPELRTPLMVRPEKIAKGDLKGFKVVEPLWVYPMQYETRNPLDPHFYDPQQWQCMGMQIHVTRLLTFVGRELPDILKPSYAFGGVSLSQMIKPYVDNWLRARQSVSDLMHSFSTMVLATDMTTVLNAGGAESLIGRAELFNRTRDNRGLMMIQAGEGGEELTNVSTPLGTLDKLQAQAQEQMASVSGIPLVILLGVTPAGLNASSDGEVRTFYATIKAYQERVFRAPLHTILDVLQLNEFGDIDPGIGFEFHDLWEMDEEKKALIRKSDADADVAYVASGIVSNEEVRARITEDEASPYYGVDLSAPAPEAPGDADELAALNVPDDVEA